jgi:hypothetical protein
LVALMVEQGGDDLLERPSPVTELHLARCGNEVELLVRELVKRREGIPRGREPVEQVAERPVLRLVLAVVSTRGYAADPSTVARTKAAMRW